MRSAVRAPAAKKTTKPAAAPPLPLGDSVYSTVKQLILSNQLRPGHKLAHQHLADRLEVSRTPVRQALERLYQEGYVIRIPARGYFVAEVKSHEARDLYQMRMALEPFALRISMTQGITPEQLDVLSRLHRTYAAHVAEFAVAERIVSDQEFHIYLASLSGNQYVVDTLQHVFERLLLKRRTDGYWPGTGKRGSAGVKEHDVLLRAVRAGRTTEAVRTLTSHLQGAWVQFEAHLLRLSVP